MGGCVGLRDVGFRVGKEAKKAKNGVLKSGFVRFCNFCNFFFLNVTFEVCCKLLISKGCYVVTFVTSFLDPPENLSTEHHGYPHKK